MRSCACRRTTNLPPGSIRKCGKPPSFVPCGRYRSATRSLSKPSTATDFPSTKSRDCSDSHRLPRNPFSLAPATHSASAGTATIPAKSWGTTAMTEIPPFSGDNGSDKELDRTLTDLLRAPPLDSQALERIRVVVENEWRTSTALQRRSRAIRRWGWASLAAVVVVIAVTTTWFAKFAGEAVVFGSISRSDGVGIDVRFASV